MESDQLLSPQQSLDLIAGTILRTNGKIRENSFAFLLWGWLIGLASFTGFFLHHCTGTPYYFIPFPILAAAGIIATAVYLKRRKSGTTLTYATYFIGKMWIVLGGCFLIVVFINVTQGKMPFTYTLIIAGIGTLVSGWVIEFRPLVIGGILLLASAIASVYIADEYKPLLHGIAIVTGYLVPGYLLKMSKK